MKKPRFTPADDSELARLWHLGTPVKLIAYRLGRPSTHSIEQRALRLGLHPHPWSWTPSHIEQLKALRLLRLPNKLIAEKLSTPAKPITEAAVRNQIWHLKLPHYHPKATGAPPQAGLNRQSMTAAVEHPATP